MDNIYHEKEEEGMFYGDFKYLTDGVMSGLYEAKCGQACINNILQSPRFTEGLAVSMDEQTLSQTLNLLHIKSNFGLSEINEMENLLLVNWKKGDLEVFGSLVAIYQVLKAEKLDLFPLTALLKPSVSAANSQPEEAKGYLFYLNDHWMVLRQLAHQWYKFDPWLTGPQMLTHFYVSLYIKQLMTDGKMVFLIDGEFPKCSADSIDLTENFDEDGKQSKDMTEEEIVEIAALLDELFETEEDKEFALALQLSMADDHMRRRQNYDHATSSTNVASSGVSTTNNTSMGRAVPSEDISSLSVNSSEPVFQVTEEDASNQLGDLDSATRTESPLRRKNGTSQTPVITNSELDLNTSSDSDLGPPFQLLFSELGEGVACMDSAPPLELSEISQPCSSSLQQIETPAYILNSEPAKSMPLQTSQTGIQIFIASTELSSFKKKVIPSSSEEEVSENEESVMCCICWAEPPSHVVVPCGHFCLCFACSINLSSQQCENACPLCKQKLTNIIKLYK